MKGAEDVHQSSKGRVLAGWRRLAGGKGAALEAEAPVAKLGRLGTAKS